MSMHLRGSRDMMGHQEEEGWWISRTGLEQKLIILSTLLFILSFGLTISVIVLKNKTCPGCPEISTTTDTPTNSTETATPPEDTSPTTVSEPTVIDTTITEPTVVTSNATSPEPEEKEDNNG